MKIYKLLATIFVALLFFTSCEDQVLDKSPRMEFTEVDVWNDFELTKMYVWNSYKSLGAWGIGKMSVTDYYNTYIIDGASDLAFGHLSHTEFETYMRGEINPDDMFPFNRLWVDHFKEIRNIAIFLQNIDKVEADATEKNRLIGEMKFIRAYIYNELLNLWGGVPIITEPFGLNDDFNKERSSYKDVVEFIVKDLDDAQSLLPETVPPEEWGRVTKGAALALKSRVLLYAASKLHDPDTQPNGPLYDYDVANKWKDASDAAKAVIDLNLYDLVQVEDFRDYNEIFLHNNEEIIFAKAHNPEYSHGACEDANRIFDPSGFGGWGMIVPIQNFVDEFQMDDGSSIDESPEYNPNGVSMYENRELRFYADIFYQGAIYNLPMIDSRDPHVQYQIPGGLDATDGPQPENASRTGYNVRKYTDESFDRSAGKQNTTPYIYFRLAEIYLNYAEAQYHLGFEDEARHYINLIRERAHLPAISSTGEDLLNDIMHERKIELCFENHRFWDVRRWMIADDVFNENAIGIQWSKKNAQGELDINGELVHNFFEVSNRNFLERMYYIPIPRSEILKSNLEQNTGYQ